MNAYLDIHYGPEAMRHLIHADRALAPYIEKYGRVSAKRDPDIFAALVSGIISDGITASSAALTESRMMALCGDFSVVNILKSDAVRMRETGLSQIKIATIRDLAENIAAKKLDLSDTLHLDDDEYVAFLAGLKGVSRHAAEMTAIFGEGRLDVFLYGDSVMQQSVMKVHGYTSYSQERYDRLKKLYSPYGTIASLYYFAIAEELPRGGKRKG
ncbi:MAG TPA: hypothetical protein DCR44_03685 [Acholeplasmatales bacterium]|nr:MAG: hypothetical protein A2Y16_01330 [Tenericutes bacterium GWF2_57_13]HAQ56485.1 hypothetical protein [Acholeplasmatales bacterium]